MTWVGRLALLLLGLGAGESQAQGRWTAGIDFVGLASDPVYAGAAVSLGLVVSRDLSLLGRIGAGRQGGETVGRGEVVLEFRFVDRARRRPVPYLGVGIAGTTGPLPGPYLIATAGLDLPASGRGHWVLEAGVAGGIRLSGGYRYSLGGRKRRTAAPGGRSFQSGDPTG
ncbi:MAG: hypothetical protein KF785_13925 [Gemmatimonadales bacterium]|nr:hypothetical protein [Gemmatimonadales bacterium]